MKCHTEKSTQMYSRLATVSSRSRSAMAFTVLRKVSLLRSMTNTLLSSQRGRFSTSGASTFVDDDDRRRRSVSDRIQLSPLFQETGRDGMKDCTIELVDDSTWNMSSGLADAWRGSKEVAALRMRSCFSDHELDGCNDNDEGGVVGSTLAANDDHDFDEIEDMRIRGNLFYKLDRSSKEYEEYKFDFHGSKFSRNEKERMRIKEEGKKENPNLARASTKDHVREIKKSEEESKQDMFLKRERRERPNSRPHEMGDSSIIKNKKQRTLTFNQLTAPYHEPFCLDVFISKGSIRASIIHRATSNVVVVAHSISKDMKFDLASTKNKNACVAVGKVLAQRALDDDIYNIVYTPRKGERIEGKLQIVVKSIIDGGVDVKVKLKQKSLKQAKHFQPRAQNLH